MITAPKKPCFWSLFTLAVYHYKLEPNVTQSRNNLSSAFCMNSIAFLMNLHLVSLINFSVDYAMTPNILNVQDTLM